jgi:hypothetical protein|tara:strand:+ start:381 stop:725 length:345 start_codon:yes stop_codon:yes gene_type:complete
MAISYEWNCKKCDTYPSKGGKSNVVHNVHWVLTAKDDTNKDEYGTYWSKSYYGSQPLDTSDLSNFKNWSSLTNSDVQGWVESALGSDKVTKMKTGLSEDIAAKITPTSVTKTIG